MEMTSPAHTRDFDDCPDRRGTGSEKWVLWTGEDMLPLWVADMDFQSPDVVLDAIRPQVDHGVFGYTDEPPDFAPVLKDRTVNSTFASISPVGNNRRGDCRSPYRTSRRPVRSGNSRKS